jgi:hypothetical protein
LTLISKCSGKQEINKANNHPWEHSRHERSFTVNSSSPASKS